MAGKTTPKSKLKKEPEINITHIDDILLRIDAAETRIDVAETNIDSALESIDKLGMHELNMRVEKVEARLGIG